MLTNAILQKLRDEGKIRLQKIIGAVLTNVVSLTNDPVVSHKFTEIVEYIEFDNSVNSGPTKYYPVDTHRTVVGMIPVYDIYAIYAVQEDKLSFMGYYSNDEMIIDNVDWVGIYNMVTKGEI